MKTEDGFSFNWGLLLLHEFYRLRQSVPELSRLQAPNITFSQAISSTLGRWHSKTRTIELSERLLQEANLEHLHEVFFHELAHQIVSELFHSTEPGHGQLFRKECDLINISASATYSFGQPGSSRQSQLFSKIRKLMALETSDSRNEAENALKKARELSLKYNISLDQSTLQHTTRPARLVKKRIPTYFWEVCSIISEFYFCLYISRRITATDGQKYQVLEFYGLPENLDVADYVFHYLIHHGEAAWHVYKKENSLKGVSRKNSFLCGVYKGFKDKLREQSQKLEQEKALVWLGDPLLKAYYSQRNPKVVTSSRRYSGYNDAHQEGVKQGRRLSLHPGVRGDRDKSKGPQLLS